jgi:hypothetical protein
MTVLEGFVGLGSKNVRDLSDDEVRSLIGDAFVACVDAVLRSQDTPTGAAVPLPVALGAGMGVIIPRNPDAVPSALRDGPISIPEFVLFGYGGWASQVAFESTAEVWRECTKSWIDKFVRVDGREQMSTFLSAAEVAMNDAARGGSSGPLVLARVLLATLDDVACMGEVPWRLTPVQLIRPYYAEKASSTAVGGPDPIDRLSGREEAAYGSVGWRVQIGLRHLGALGLGPFDAGTLIGRLVQALAYGYHPTGLPDAVAAAQWADDLPPAFTASKFVDLCVQVGLDTPVVELLSRTDIVELWNSPDESESLPLDLRSLWAG